MREPSMTMSEVDAATLRHYGRLEYREYLRECGCPAADIEAEVLKMFPSENQS